VKVARFPLAVLAAFGALAFVPGPALAALPELRITPLRYDAHLDLGHTKTGFIDASNPTGSTLHVKFEVQAFRQANDQGELEYYDDERLAAAVTPAVPEFDLGPRQAIRTKFTIDPNKLGPGGAYGVIFLRTTTPAVSPGQINTSARVGSLLILRVGPGGTQAGRLRGLAAPGLVYGGDTLRANFSYANTGSGSETLAFAPALSAAAGWNGAKHRLLGPFVFPGRARRQSVSLPVANWLGPIPITITDQTGRSPAATVWVFAVTGYWTWVLPLLLTALIGLTVIVFKKRSSMRSRRKKPAPKSVIKVTVQS